MVNDPDIQKIITTITETYQELAEVNEKLEPYFPLLKRRRELEERIKKWKEVFGVDRLLKEETPSLAQSIFPLSPPTQPKRRKSMRTQRGKKIWQLVESLMKEIGPYMSFKQIKQASVERGWITDDANGGKILYRALKDKQNKIFIQTERGRWVLKDSSI